MLISRALRVNFFASVFIRPLLKNAKKDRYLCFRAVASLLKKNDFRDLRSYHTNNYVTPSGGWIFNGVNFGRKWPRETKDKEDYTPDLVFCYLEWLFSFEKLQLTDDQKNSLKRATRSSLWCEPSANSLNLYPILWAVLNRSLSYEHSFELLLQNFENLIKKIEFGVGANHLIDNFLSISIYALIFGHNRFSRFSFFFAVRLLSRATRDGYYAEKTPVYALGLAIRLQFVWVLLSRLQSTKVNEQSILEILGRLLNFPRVHLNDSYLPAEILRQDYEILNYRESPKMVPGYFLSRIYNDFEVNLVINGVGSRGYRSHSHDSSMSLFVNSASTGIVYIGSFGTPEYANTSLRMRSKQAGSYASVEKGEPRKLKGSASFRVERIFEPEVVQGVKAVTDRKSGVTYIFKDAALIIQISEPNEDAVFYFWSSTDTPFASENKTQLRFDGYDSYQVTACTTFDGIYNERDAWLHRIIFRNELELKFLND